MKAIFISGIPASGKSYLAQRLAKELDGIHVEIDDLREGLASVDKYKKWVNFYLDQDEKTYYLNTSPDEQWKNLVMQSEAIWPEILKKIKSCENETKVVIFEAVNILPHLAKKASSLLS
jgi:2-phosphoglycerate kinase